MKAYTYVLNIPLANIMQLVGKLYCYWCRRIRDQLLQDDRFSLAKEISTKCNLDTLSVWASWGMALLRVGDFEKAREKLKLCFLVCKIIACLYSGTPVSLTSLRN